MERLSRRTFARRLVTASLFPIAFPAARAQTATSVNELPGTIAGYVPDAGEREAMARFLADHDNALAPLRAQMLPNGLAPATLFRPTARKVEGGKRR